MEYWESACQTIYDVAAALNIPLEVEPDKRHPKKPTSVDLKLTEREIARYQEASRTPNR
jgi:hypothetical protein